MFSDGLRYGAIWGRAEDCFRERLNIGCCFSHKYRQNQILHCSGVSAFCRNFAVSSSWFFASLGRVNSCAYAVGAQWFLSISVLWKVEVVMVGKPCRSPSVSPFVVQDGPVRETCWCRVWQRAVCPWLWFISEGFCLFACSPKPNHLVSWWLKRVLEEGQTPKGTGLVVRCPGLWWTRTCSQPFTLCVGGLQGPCCDKHSLITFPPLQLTNSTYFTFHSLRRGHLLFHFLFFWKESPSSSSPCEAEEPRQEAGPGRGSWSRRCAEETLVALRKRLSLSRVSPSVLPVS